MVEALGGDLVDQLVDIFRCKAVGESPEFVGRVFEGQAGVGDGVEQFESFLVADEPFVELGFDALDEVVEGRVRLLQRIRFGLLLFLGIFERLVPGGLALLGPREFLGVGDAGFTLVVAGGDFFDLGAEGDDVVDGERFEGFNVVELEEIEDLILFAGELVFPFGGPANGEDLGASTSVLSCRICSASTPRLSSM
ncbi:MAG: hypothetical protein ACREDT_05575 [Methylocella sp.]